MTRAYDVCTFGLKRKEIFSPGGRTNFLEAQMAARRFAYLLNKGDIAENMVVHQTCENSGCVNPEHLELQTKSQNKRSYNSVRVSKEMIEKESVKYLFRLRNIRPDLEEKIDALLMMLVSEKTQEEDDFGFESETKGNGYV